MPQARPAGTGPRRQLRSLDVRAIIAFEEAHKDRSSVVSAAQVRVAAIAKQVAGV